MGFFAFYMTFRNVSICALITLARLVWPEEYEMLLLMGVNAQNNDWNVFLLLNVMISELESTSCTLQFLGKTAKLRVEWMLKTHKSTKKWAMPKIKFELWRCVHV